MRILNNLR
jgi:Ca2+-binding EF-hand superfamily protein